MQAKCRNCAAVIQDVFPRGSSASTSIKAKIKAASNAYTTPCKWFSNSKSSKSMFRASYKSGGLMMKITPKAQSKSSDSILMLLDPRLRRNRLRIAVQKDVVL